MSEEKTVRVCEVEGCGMESRGLGLCSMHYQRFKKCGNPGVAERQLNRYVYNTTAFTNEDDISYYLLGCFMSDGHVIVNEQPYTSTITGEITTHYTKTCGLTSNDRDWLELINQYICPERPITERNRNGESGETCYDIDYGCPEICEWLISKGCTPRKSLTLEYPIGMPDKFLPDWLRGMIDGDGSVALYHRYRKDRECWEKDRSCCLYSSSKALVDELMSKLTSIGFESRVYVRIFGDRPIEDRIITSCNPNYRLYFKNAENTYRFLKMVYYEGNRIAMPRKAQGALDIITDWERPYFCEECRQSITIGTIGRCQKFCEPCGTIRKKASQKKSSEKYAAKKKAKKEAAQEIDSEENIKRAAKNSSKKETT